MGRISVVGEVKGITGKFDTYYSSTAVTLTNNGFEFLAKCESAGIIQEGDIVKCRGDLVFFK